MIFSFAVRAGNFSLKDAEKFAYARGTELLSCFNMDNSEEKYEKLDSLLLEYVDLPYIAKFVMGKYWKEMSAEQQEKYLNLFEKYALNLYRGFPLNFKNKLSFDVVSSEMVNGDAMVLTAIKLKSDNVNEMNVEVNFRLHDDGKKFMIRDIKVGENSLVLVYRQRFQEMMKEADEEISWFLEDFELVANSPYQTYK